jgi:predicted HAD superfamily Cof-like phosphohydrolase
MMPAIVLAVAALLFAAALATRPRRREPDITGRVRDFHRAFGFHIGTWPWAPPDKIRRERARLIAEECAELIAAMLAGHPDRARLHAELCRIFAERSVAGDGPYDSFAVASESGDVVYVVGGGSVNWDFPLGAVFEAIHEANMRKLGPDGRPIIDGNGKAVKPPGWQPADIAGLLGRRGTSHPTARGSRT